MHAPFTSLLMALTDMLYSSSTDCKRLPCPWPLMNHDKYTTVKNRVIARVHSIAKSTSNLLIIIRSTAECLEMVMFNEYSAITADWEPFDKRLSRIQLYTKDKKNPWRRNAEKKKKK